MAITYTINKCKGGHFGLYVKALSRNELEALAYKMPALRALYPENYKQVSEYRHELIAVPLGAIPVKSGRIARKPTYKAIQSLMFKFQNQPREEQIKRLHKLFINPIGNKDYTILKVQYTKLSRQGYGDTETYIPLMTSINRTAINKLTDKYINRDVNVKLTPTINRHIKVEKSDTEAAREQTKTTGYYYTDNKGNKHYHETDIVSKPKGAQKGFTKEIKDQTNEYLRRITQKRKKTTTNQFWAKR